MLLDSYKPVRIYRASKRDLHKSPSIWRILVFIAALIEVSLYGFSAIFVAISLQHEEPIPRLIIALASLIITRLVAYLRRLFARFAADFAIISLCKKLGWEIVNDDEVDAAELQGYIGKGERNLADALQRSPHLACKHQVKISDWYTADLICYHLGSERLAVVEVDGRQHWCDPEQVHRDNSRMQRLASIGVHTIRFTNFDAHEKPAMCARVVSRILRR